jgi:hypothetical protein
MSPINLAVVGLRLLAVYCFVESVPLFSAFGLVGTELAQTAGRSQTSTVIEPLLPPILLLLSAIFLFIFSKPLARRLTFSLVSDGNESVCTFEQLQALAFAVAGVLIIATSLPSLGRAVQDLFILYSYHKQGGTNSTDRVFSSWLYSIGVFAQLALGLVLLLNKQGFRNAWRWLRKAGT